MKRLSLLIASLFFVVGMPFVGGAQVNFNVNVPPPPGPPPPQEAAPPPGPPPPQEGAPPSVAPPPLQFAGPPDVVVVPSGGADVYLVPGMPGLSFFGGFWYRFYSGYWFRAALYSGPWIGIGAAFVPGPLVVIPPDYVLGMPAGYYRIHYGDFYAHWRDWGRTHYWNRQPWYRDHALHHWGGRAFVRPGVGHGGGYGRPGVKPPGPRMGTNRGPAPGERGSVSHGANIGHAGGRSVGGEGSKGGRGAEHR